MKKLLLFILLLSNFAFASEEEENKYAMQAESKARELEDVLVQQLMKEVYENLGDDSLIKNSQAMKYYHSLMWQERVKDLDLKLAKPIAKEILAMKYGKEKSEQIIQRREKNDRRK